MISVKKTGFARRFRRELVETLPETASTAQIARALDVSRMTVQRWKAAGLAFAIDQNQYWAGNLFRRDDVIRWLIDNGRVYIEEWGDWGHA